MAAPRPTRLSFELEEVVADLAHPPFVGHDRAARNLFDYVELERLEAEHGVPAVSVYLQTLLLLPLIEQELS